MTNTQSNPTPEAPAVAQPAVVVNEELLKSGIELVSHLSNILEDEVWEQIDTQVFNRFTSAIAAAEAAKGGVPIKCEYTECKHPDCGRFYDHNSRGMSCKALAVGACAAKGGV